MVNKYLCCIFKEQFTSCSWRGCWKELWMSRLDTDRQQTHYGRQQVRADVAERPPSKSRHGYLLHADAAQVKSAVRIPQR